LWKELYDSLLEDRIYKITQIFKDSYGIYYQLEDTYNHFTTPFYPEEVFHSSDMKVSSNL